MSKWRPKGWKNPFVGVLDFTGTKPTFNTTNNHKSEKTAFEAGADAMLEKLRERGRHVNGNASFSSLGEHYTLSNEGNTGTYLFIPDDEAR